MNKLVRSTYLSFLPSGYGHYRVTTELRGRIITAVTHDMPLIDACNSDNDAKSYAARKRLILWCRKQQSLKP